MHVRSIKHRTRSKDVLGGTRLGEQNRVALTARVVFEGEGYCGATSGTEAPM